MIIWFDNAMTMHVDKQHDANSSFALAKYVPVEFNKEQVVFKANAVVNGHTILFTHTQVTYYGSRMIGWVGSSSATVRRHFFKQYLSTIENSIKNYLRGTKSYNGEIKLRFRVGEGTIDLFPNYSLVNRENCFDNGGYYYACFCIIEKKLQ